MKCFIRTRQNKKRDVSVNIGIFRPKGRSLLHYTRNKTKTEKRNKNKKNYKMLVGLVWARPCWGEFWALSTTEGYIRASMFGWVSFSFEPSQPHRVISGLVCWGERGKACWWGWKEGRELACLFIALFFSFSQHQNRYKQPLNLPAV